MDNAEKEEYKQQERKFCFFGDRQESDMCILDRLSIYRDPELASAFSQPWSKSGPSRVDLALTWL